MGGLSDVWAEKRRRRSPAMTTEGGVGVMMTEGGIEVQLEREKQGRESESNGSARTFIGPAARGGAPPRNSVSLPKSGAPIGPDPLRGPATMARYRNIPFPAR